STRDFFHSCSSCACLATAVSRSFSKVSRSTAHWSCAVCRLLRSSSAVLRSLRSFFWSASYFCASWIRSCSSCRSCPRRSSSRVLFGLELVACHGKLPAGLGKLRAHVSLHRLEMRDEFLVLLQDVGERLRLGGLGHQAALRPCCMYRSTADRMASRCALMAP